MSWIVAVTFTAGWQKIFSADKKIGFLAHSALLNAALASGKVAAAKIAETHTMIFNDRLDAAVCGTFIVLVVIVLVDSVRTWVGLLSGRKQTTLSETPFMASRLTVETL